MADETMPPRTPKAPEDTRSHRGLAPYRSPALTIYGSLEAITRATGNTSNKDGGGSAHFMKSRWIRQMEGASGNMPVK